MFINFPEDSSLESKKLENLSLILGYMKIEKDINHVRSMPYFVLETRGAVAKMRHDGTCLQVFNSENKPIAFAKSDGEDSFSEIRDGKVAENILTQMQWIQKHPYFPGIQTSSKLEFCYISAPIINIFCVGLYEYLDEGPKFWHGLDEQGGRHVFPMFYIGYLIRNKILNRPYKGLSKNGVPPN